MATFSMIYTALLLWVTLATAGQMQPTQNPSTTPILGRHTSQGCFESLSLSAALSHGQQSFVSSGMCGSRCRQEGKAVAITQVNRCYCADTYPSRLLLLDDNQCDYPCPGYPMHACGSLKGAYSVLNTGLEMVVENDAHADDDNHDKAPSKTCHSTLMDINDVAEEILTAAELFLSKIRVFFNEAVDYLVSGATEQPSEEEKGADL